MAPQIRHWWTSSLWVAPQMGHRFFAIGGSSHSGTGTPR
jgi:hypothetical protein